MNWKRREKLLHRIGFALVALASIPTIYWAITSVLAGKHGDSIDNFKGQPLHPVLVLIIFAFLAVILPIIYFKNKSKNRK